MTQPHKFPTIDSTSWVKSLKMARARRKGTKSRIMKQLINFQELEEKGWQFDYVSDPDKGLAFKSPRMANWNFYSPMDGNFWGFEVKLVLNEKANILDGHFSDVKREILKDFKILLERNLDLPKTLTPIIEVNF